MAFVLLCNEHTFDSSFSIVSTIRFSISQRRIISRILSIPFQTSIKPSIVWFDWSDPVIPEHSVVSNYTERVVEFRGKSKTHKLRMASFCLRHSPHKRMTSLCQAQFIREWRPFVADTVRKRMASFCLRHSSQENGVLLSQTQSAREWRPFISDTVRNIMTSFCLRHSSQENDVLLPQTQFTKVSVLHHLWQDFSVDHRITLWRLFFT